MNVIYEGQSVTLTKCLDVRSLLQNAVTSAIESADERNDKLLRHEMVSLLTHLQSTNVKFPALTKVTHASLQCQAIVLQWQDPTVLQGKGNDNRLRCNCALQILMPCQEASLLWMPWLPHQRPPAEQRGPHADQHY